MTFAILLHREYGGAEEMQRVCEMRITNRCASAAFKALLAAGGWTGILLQCGVFSVREDFSLMR